MWNAGAGLMVNGSPASWVDLVAADRLARANRQVIEGTERRQAALAHPLISTVTVAYGPSSSFHKRALA